MEKAFLTSKVARRIFLLFIFCALLPLFILGGITFRTVNTQLADQARKRLSQNCKLKGLEIYNNLGSLDTELRLFAAGGRAERAGAERVKCFRNLRVVGEHQALPGIHKPSPGEIEHMKMGRSLVFYGESGEGLPAIYMARFVEPDRTGEGIAVGEVEPSFLWGIESEQDVIGDMPMFILTPKGKILFSLPRHLKLERKALDMISSFPVAGTFEYKFEGQQYLTGYWALFLKYHFFTPGWIIVMSQSKAGVLAPVAYFKEFFFLFALLTFLVVCLLSVTLIRKNLVPIETLRKGTEKIAQGEFGIEVDIRSRDEFENLGNAFNEMSRKLKEGRALLVQSAKMGAVGQMASGIVHEIGQPLTSISGLIDLLLIKERAQEGQKKHLDLMKKEMERLTGIISRFKNFARVSEQTMKPVSINEVVDASYALLEHQIQIKNIDCQVEKGEHLPSILGEKNSLQQVLINLVINAMDSVQEKKGDHSIVDIRTFLNGNQVCLQVKDNGTGIPEKIRERIFDPFFTTKGPESGTGLGLAIIESILHQHKAKITLESEEGVGTSFVISFPVI
jgi:signal transduction histidine kinase